MRRPAVAALLAAVVLLLAGCAVIPTSGVVQPGTTEAPNGTKLVYVPSKPAPGATPDEIVNGFLTAASGVPSFATARAYLTDGFAKKWDPTTRVLVQGPQAKLKDSGDEVRAEIPLVATVDGNGSYTPMSDVQPLEFHLVQQRGQWRIDFAENGIVLTQPVFQQTYQPRLLQFFDPTWSRLVPDRRWFPVSRTVSPSVADIRTVVDALIDGPDGPLSGSVTANALEGAKLEGISPSTGGVPTVTLTTPGGRADATAAARMQQQLIQSLGQSAPALRLVVDDLVIPQAKPSTDQLSTEAYVLAAGRFGTLSSSGTFLPDRTLGARIAATAPAAVTVSMRQKLAAVQTQSGAVAVVTPSGARRLDARPDPDAAPTLDQNGWVYWVSSSGALKAWKGGHERTVDTELGSGTVSSIQTSPDGTRLLVLLESSAGPTAFVAGIERDSSAAPVALTGARYPIDLTSAVPSGVGGITWVDDDEVAVLINGNDSDQIVTQQVGGISGVLGQFANVTSIVGTTSTADLRVLVQSGSVYVWNDTNSNWQQQSDPTLNVSVLAVQR